MIFPLPPGILLAFLSTLTTASTPVEVVKSELQPAARDLAGIREQAHRHLRDAFLPFWYDHSWDDRNGGFVTQLSRDGSWYEANDRRLIMQARMLWTFAAAHRAGLGERDYLNRAMQGFLHLENNFLDKEYGGYFYATDASGTPTDSSKILYAQAFVLYALSELYLAGLEPSVLEAATRLFDLIEAHAHDSDNPGYLEDFERDWTFRERSAVIAMERVKTLNTHMHLMEACTTFAQASPKPEHLKALEGLYHLIVSSCVNASEGFAWEPYSMAFQPIPGPTGEWITSYSHNIELAWLLADAADTLGIPPDDYRDVVLGLVNHTLQYGFDWNRGGILTEGLIGTQPLHPESSLPEGTVKGWWEQAEALVGLLYARQLDDRPDYTHAFIQTWNLIWNNFIDHQTGAWFPFADWHTGHYPGDRVGSEWKAAYHDGRSLMQVSRLLKAAVP